MSKNTTLSLEDSTNLLDLTSDQLTAIVEERQGTILRLKQEIAKQYEQALPFLLEMRKLKDQLKKEMTKLEACKIFLAMEKNGSLISNIDLESLGRTVSSMPELSRRHTEPEPQRIVTPESPKKTPKKSLSSSKFKNPSIAEWASKKR